MGINTNEKINKNLIRELIAKNEKLKVVDDVSIIAAENISKVWKECNENGILYLPYDDFAKLTIRDPRLRLNFDNYNRIPTPYQKLGIIPLVTKRRTDVAILPNTFYYDCSFIHNEQCHYIKDNSCKERQEYYARYKKVTGHDISEAEQFARLECLGILEILFSDKNWHDGGAGKMSINNIHKLRVKTSDGNTCDIDYGPVDIECDGVFENDVLHSFCNIELKKEERDSFYIPQLYNTMLAIMEDKTWLCNNISLYFMMQDDVFRVMAFTFDDVTNPESIRLLDSISFTTNIHKAKLFDYYDKNGNYIMNCEKGFVESCFDKLPEKNMSHSNNIMTGEKPKKVKKEKQIEGQMSLFDMMSY